MRSLLAGTRAELLRLGKWPALWVMAGTWLLLNILFVYVFNYLAYHDASAGPMSEGMSRAALMAAMMPAAVPQSVVQGMPMFGGAIVMILGALTAGSGYNWGTWKTVLTQRPGRLSVFAASLTALAVVIVALVLATFVVDLGISLLVASVESQPITWPGLGEVARALGGGMLIFSMWGTGGALIGILARGPALAVGLGLVWALVVENLLRGVASLLGPLEPVTDLMPGTAAGSLAGSFDVGLGAGGDDTPVCSPSSTPHRPPGCSPRTCWCSRSSPWC